MDESRLEGGGESGVELMGEGWFACGMTDHMLACYRPSGRAIWNGARYFPPWWQLHLGSSDVTAGISAVTCRGCEPHTSPADII